MTRKLYDENAYTAVFSAKVLSCDGTSVVLDQTAFFPEGGGQAADTGTLGGIAVTDVQEQGGIIYHTCAAPLPVGSTVEGKIHWAQRFSRMQQHSGEHVLSGLVHALFGYDNVGFHMGLDSITVDFSGKLTDADLALLQEKANTVIWENRPIRAWYPMESELSSLSYRSKKELAGPVRLVEIENIDLCACCAPHVAHTGEIGPIVILSRESFHGGTRLQMLCGERAFSHLAAVLEQNKAVAALCSVKPHETHTAVTRLADELGETKLRLSQTAKELYAALADLYREAGDVLLMREDGDAGKLAVAVGETCGGLCAVFVKTETGFRYAVCGETAKEFTTTLHAALGGKGGGKPNFVQGSVPADKKEIENFWETRT